MLKFPTDPAVTMTSHCDPAHGWLEVDWTQLKALGLNPSDFSRYSYRRGNTFFLEEDCDATLFIRAYGAKHGKVPAFVDQTSQGDSFVRSLPRIDGPFRNWRAAE